MAGLPPVKKPCRANFTDAEMLTIVEEVKRREHVMGRLDNTVTASAKFSPLVSLAYRMLSLFNLPASAAVYIWYSIV